MSEPLPAVQNATVALPSAQVSGAVFNEQNRVGIGSGLEALGQGVNDIAVQAATAKGQQDGAQPIQRDADGNAMPVPRDNFIFGDAGKAYAHAIDVGQLAGVQTNINERVAELRQRYQADPDGFKVAVGAMADGVKSNFSGALGAAAFSHAIQTGSEHYISLVDQNRTTDVAKNLQATQTRIADLGTDIENIARGTISPDTKFLEDPTTPAGAKIAQRNLYLQQLASNPDWAKTFSPEMIDSQIRMDKQRFINAWSLGNAQNIRDTQGVDAAISWAQKNVLNSDSNMPYSERQGAYNGVVSKILTLTTDQQAKATASQQAVATFTKAMAEGVYPGEVAFQNALKNARELFDAAGVGQLQAAHDVYFKRLQPVAGLPPAAGIYAITGPQQPGVAKPFDPANIAGYLDKTHAIENPTGNPAARSPTGAAGDFQFTKGTAATMAAKYGPFDPNDPAQSRDMAGKLAIDNAKQLQSSLGRAPTEGEVYLAHQQGAGGAAALIAHPSENAVSALANHAGLSLEDADRNIRVNGGNPNMTAGQFAAKWTGKFDGAAPVAGANSPVPFTKEQLDANPFLAAASVRAALQDKPIQIAYAKQQIGLMEGAISLGTPPAPAQMAKIQQIAQANPQELGDAFTKLQAHVAANPAAMAVAGQPDGGAAYLAQVDNIARSSPDLWHQEYASSLRSQIAGRAKQLADAPHEYAARNDVGWSAPTTPMDALANPQSIGAASPEQALQSIVATRRDSAFQISQRTQQPAAGLLFQKNDIDQLTSALQKSDGPAADMLLRGLSGNLRPEEMQALAANKDFSGAVVGLTRSGDPDKVGAAYGFLDKQWRENRPAFLKDYPGVETQMQIYQNDIAYKSAPDAIKRLQRADDPAVAAAMEDRGKVADKELESITADKVLRKIAPGAMGGWIPWTGAGAPVSNDMNASSDAMRAEWAYNYRDLRANGLDQAGADAGATERLRKVWSPSETNGGRVMRFAPEAFYPKDATGGQRYIADQLAQDVTDTAKAHGIDLAPGAEHALVADQATEQDIANRRPPSYKVVITDVDGRAHLLEQRPGVALRFRADASDILPGGGADQARMLKRAQSAQNMGMGAR